jgi:methionine-rich copper-binding protein CopC
MLPHLNRGRLTAAAAAALVTVVALPLPASAHSELVDSTPKAGSVLAEAPRQVELVFNEPVQDQGSSIVVTLDGTTVSDSKTFTTQNTTASVQLDGAGDPGTYVVEYRVVSEDGHIVDETFSYSVQGSPNSTGTTAPAPTSDQDSDESSGTVVWVLGAGAIGLVLVAALIAVAMRGRRGRSS